MESKKVVLDLEQIDELETRVRRAGEMIRSLREERDAARAGLLEARAEADRLVAEQRTLQKDHQGALEASAQLGVLLEEREAIRGRVTRMLEMMAALDDGPAPARSDH